MILQLAHALQDIVGKTEPVSAYDELDNDDLYVRYKKLQQQLEFLEVQEEYIKVKRNVITDYVFTDSFFFISQTAREKIFFHLCFVIF